MNDNCPTDCHCPVDTADTAHVLLLRWAETAKRQALPVGGLLGETLDYLTKNSGCPLLAGLQTIRRRNKT